MMVVSLHTENSNYREDFAEGTWKFIRIKEVLLVLNNCIFVK